jgi:protein ImuA
MAPEKRALLASLRERVRQIERGGFAHGVLPFGTEAIDRALPGGGLARGALHEILGAGGDEEDGALPAAFAAFILGRLAAEGGRVLWCLAAADLYGPGLAAVGLDPARLFLVEARRDDRVLWAMEEGLRTPGITAVAGEVGRLDLLGSRRLQLAAERSGTAAFALRRWKSGEVAARWRGLPNAAATRWRIGTLPSRMRAEEPGIGRPHWRVELVRCRGGMPACWEVEVEDGAGLVSVAQRVADRPPAKEDGSPLALRPTGS